MVFDTETSNLNDTGSFEIPERKRIQNIVEENAPSPLLDKLPTELRQKIWTYILRNQTIHIKFSSDIPRNPQPDRNNRPRGIKYFNPGGQFKYILCEAQVSEQQGYELSKDKDFDVATPYDSQYDYRLSSSRHEVCYRRCYDSQYDPYRGPHPYTGARDKRRERTILKYNRLDIRILQVCRQIYLETNHILWSTTNWSFSHAVAFFKFMSSRSISQKTSMRKLHLEIDPRNCWFRNYFAIEWKFALQANMLKAFTELESLQIDYRGDERDWRGVAGGRKWPVIEKKQLEGLRHVPWKVVRVTCMQVFVYRPGRNRKGMKFERRVRFAEELREYICDFEGKGESVRLAEEKRRRDAGEETETDSDDES